MNMYLYRYDIDIDHPTVTTVLIDIDKLICIDIDIDGMETVMINRETCTCPTCGGRHVKKGGNKKV